MTQGLNRRRRHNGSWEEDMLLEHVGPQECLIYTNASEVLFTKAI